MPLSQENLKTKKSQKEKSQKKLIGLFLIIKANQSRRKVMSMPNFKSYTIEQLSNEVKVEIYKRIQSDHKNDLTEDEFYDIVTDITYEELDNVINIMYKDEVDRLLCEYYIADAVALYISVVGWDKEVIPTNETYLFYVIEDNLDCDYQDYKVWREANQ